MTLLLLLLLQEGVLDPEAERRAFDVAPGYEVNLYAAEPWIANPVQMTFDARGRLWVVCMQSFPQIEAGKLPSDTLVVLEDRDGDGRADRHTVFADDLHVPTGVELGDGGAYVANQPDLLFLKDTDGDGKADVRKILFSGFGSEDNHHAISTFNWGPGGWLYMHSGIFLHTQVETPRGPVRLNAIAGVFEVRPKSADLRYYLRSQEMTNPWGHAFDRWGQDVLFDASQNASFWFVAPGRVDAIIPPGYPRITVPRVTCGAVFASGDHVPDALRGHLVVNNVTRKAVIQYRVADEASGFAISEVQPPIVQSRANAFRPVDVKMGPDGAIYVLDFSNPIVGQMTYNFRDPRRDHTHGRVWRITAKGRPLLKPPAIEGAAVPALLEQLKSPYDYVRYKARRELAERDAKGALADWTKGLTDEHDRLEALWLHQTIDAVEPRLLAELLRSPEPRARAAATRVLGYWHDRVERPLDLLAAQAVDGHPRVRLEAVVAVSRIASPRSFEIAMSALDRPPDRYLEQALKLALVALRPHWLPAAESGALRHPKLAWALQAVAAESGPALLAQLRSGRLTEAERAKLIELVAEKGTPNDLSALLDEATIPFAALARSARERNVRPRGDLSRVRRWFPNPEAIRLAGAWKVEAAAVEEIARGDGPLAERVAALDALAEMGIAKPLLDLATAGFRPAIASLAAVHPASAAALAAGRFGDDLLPAFLARKGGAEALAAALEASPPGADAAKVALRKLYAAGREEPALVAILKKAAGVGGTKRETADLVREVKAKGDPARGEAVFRRKESGCFQCHGIAGAGGQAGPDLATIGSSSPVDYLVESILQPNKLVKENYVGVRVLTTAGEVISGTKVRETSKELVLREPLRGEVAVPLSRVEARKEGFSLMPEGLADLLTEQELLDLAAFLSALGRPGPYAAPSIPVVRRWRVSDAKGETPPLPDDPIWTSAYSDVSGTLPAGASWVEFQLDVTTAGKIGIDVRAEPGWKAWVDGVAVEPLAPVLERGLHRVTLRVDPREGVRCELLPSAGRALIVGGR